MGSGRGDIQPRLIVLLGYSLFVEGIWPRQKACPFWSSVVAKAFLPTLDPQAGNLGSGDVIFCNFR